MGIDWLLVLPYSTIRPPCSTSQQEEISSGQKTDDLDRPLIKLYVQALTEEMQDQGLRGCPPCTEPKERECYGGHVQQEQPCSRAHDFSCGQECGALLSCGNHTCSRTCHANPAGGKVLEKTFISRGNCLILPEGGQHLQPNVNLALIKSHHHKRSFML